MFRTSQTACLLCISVYYILNVSQKTIASLHINGTANKSTRNDTVEGPKMKLDDSTAVGIDIEVDNDLAKLKQNVNDNSTEVAGAERSSRKNVKLTMKQGLIMNQIIGVYALANTKNVLCKNHTEEFKAGLRAFESWALKMFDASSKVPAGILAGNIVEFGSFEQCVNIRKYSQYGLIRGQFCTVRVIPGVKLLKQILKLRNVTERRFHKVKSNILAGIKLIWSVCVPHTCKAEDVLRHFNQSIKELTEGLDLNVTLDDENCSVKDEKNERFFDNKTILYIAILSVIPLNVFIASLLEWKTRGTRNTYVNTFSIYSNGKRLFAGTVVDSELDCLHGIRFLSICYVMFGHRFQMGMLFPTVNSLYLLDWVQEYQSTIIIGGTVCVDSFLFVSSTLVAYNFFNAVNQHKKFNLVLFYVYRYLRISLSFAVVIFLYMTLIDKFGSGPLWYETLTGLQKPCQYFWWSTLLHIQPYVNPATMCVVQTWYLSDEMLMYYVSPVILYPLWKWPMFGCINLLLMLGFSISITFYLTWRYKYEGGMLLTRELFASHFFQRFYITPHTRASPYIIGLGFGYTLHRMQGRTVEMGPLITILGWASAAATMLAVVVGCHVFQDEFHEYNRLEASIHQALARSAWVLAIAWIIWACINGYGGSVNSVLSLQIFRILGRISYAIFLIHMGTQFLREGVAKIPGYYSNLDLLYKCSGDFGIVMILATIFTLLYESPFNNMIKLIFSGNKRKLEHMKDLSN